MDAARHSIFEGSPENENITFPLHVGNLSPEPRFPRSAKRVASFGMAKSNNQDVFRDVLQPNRTVNS